MAFLIFITSACFVLSTQADPCQDNQHCSNCDPKSGDCITECEIGYYDQQCKSHCSKNCKDKKCKLLEDVGTGVCTEGCEPGFQGVNCRLICSDPTQNCSKCQDGCDGEYCTQGDTCFSGCQDSYYGLACKDCSRCQSCNRITGTCDRCHSQYYGKNCEYSCHYCSGSCGPDCTRVCAPGLYGTVCVDMCSENCLPNPALYSEEQCMEQHGNTTNECTPECHSESGECIHGCVSGWYGPKCEHLCNSNCINKRCDNTGACEEGCTVGHFGKDCKPCSDICSNYTCVSNNGSCLQECTSEVYGQFCNLTSRICIDDVCAQITDKCTKECSISEEGCTSTCSTNVPTTKCSDGMCPMENPATSVIWLCAVSLAALLFVAVAGCYICYRKRLCTSRFYNQQEASCSQERDDDEGEEENIRKQRNSEHIYHDIDTNEMGPVIVFL